MDQHIEDARERYRGGCNILFRPFVAVGKSFVHFVQNTFKNKPFLRENIMDITLKSSQITLALLWSLWLRKTVSEYILKDASSMEVEKLFILVFMVFITYIVSLIFLWSYVGIYSEMNHFTLGLLAELCAISVRDVALVAQLEYVHNYWSFLYFPLLFIGLVIIHVIIDESIRCCQYRLGKKSEMKESLLNAEVSEGHEDANHGHTFEGHHGGIREWIEDINIDAVTLCTGFCAFYAILYLLAGEWVPFEIEEEEEEDRRRFLQEPHHGGEEEEEEREDFFDLWRHFHDLIGHYHWTMIGVAWVVVLIFAIVSLATGRLHTRLPFQSFWSTLQKFAEGTVAVIFGCLLAPPYLTDSSTKQFQAALTHTIVVVCLMSFFSVRMEKHKAKLDKQMTTMQLTDQGMIQQTYLQAKRGLRRGRLHVSIESVRLAVRGFALSIGLMWEKMWELVAEERGGTPDMMWILFLNTLLVGGLGIAIEDEYHKHEEGKEAESEEDFEVVAEVSDPEEVVEDITIDKGPPKSGTDSDTNGSIVKSSDLLVDIQNEEQNTTANEIGKKDV